MRSKLALLALCLGLTALPLAALPLGAAETTASWPATRAGALAKAWVTAFNGGPEKMREFLATNMAKSALGERAVPARIVRYEELREEYGRLQLDQVTQSAPLELTARLLDADAKRREFVFKAEERAPFKLQSVSMKQPGIHGMFGFPGHGR